MIVPFAKGQAQQAPAQAQPSETDMLMALAVMHAQGRFDQDRPPGSIQTISKSSDKWQDPRTKAFPKEFSDPAGIKSGKEVPAGVRTPDLQQGTRDVRVD